MATYLPVLLVSVSTNAVPDDSSLVTGPRGQVDYLSHDWQEEDVWRSWRNMTRQKNEIANGARLENASWRTWWKQRNKLKTVSPETLNWLKDSDVTWLYGPLHTAVEWTPPPKPAPVPDSVDTDPASAHDRLDLHPHRPRRPAPHKPILKHRSISELLTSDFPPSPAFSPVDSEEEDADDDTRANTALNRTDSLAASKLHRPSLTHTKSDTHITRWGASRTFRKDSPPRIAPPGFDAANASFFPPHLSPSSALAAPSGIRISLSQDSTSSGSAEREKGQQPKKKHISFNTFVEQCIAIEKPKKNQSGFFGVGNHNEEGVWIEGRAGFVDDDGYDEDQEDSEGEEEEEEAVYGEDTIWEAAGARAIRSDSDSQEEGDEGEEDEEEDILEIRTHHSHSTTKPKPKKPPRSQSAVSTASSSSSTSTTSTTTSTSSRSSSATTSTTSPASSLSPSRRNTSADINNDTNGTLLRKGSTSSSASTATATSRRRGSGSSSMSASGSTSGYRAGRRGAPPLIRTPSTPVHVTIAPIAPTILKTGGAWEEGFGDEGASDDGFPFGTGAGVVWGPSKDGKGKERRGSDTVRVRSGHGPELDGYGTGGGYISNDLPSSNSTSPRLGASASAHYATLPTSPAAAPAAAPRASTAPRRQFSIATGRGLGLGGSAQEQQQRYPYDDAQGGSSDGTPVELVYCPPIGSNYSLGAGAGEDSYGGGGVYGSVYGSGYGSGYANGYGSGGGLGYEGEGYAPGRYPGGYSGYASSGMYAGGYGGAGGTVGGVYGPGGVHANARYEVGGGLEAADEAEEEHVEHVLDALDAAANTTSTSTNGLPEYLHPNSVRAAAPIPIAAGAVPTVVVEGAPAAASLLSTSAPGGARSGVAAMRQHQQKSRSSTSLSGTAGAGVPVAPRSTAVDEEDAYDFFGGADLGGDYYYARRGGRGYEREYAPAPAAAPRDPQQFAAQYQAAYQHSVGGAEREPRSSTRDRDRGSDARRPARGALAVGGEERMSRSRSRSQSRTPSPAFLSSPAPVASPSPTATPTPVSAANANATAYANAYASAYAASITTVPGGGRRRSSSASAQAPPGSWMSASASAPALDAGFLSPPLPASLLSQGRPTPSQASSPSPSRANQQQQPQSQGRGRSSTRTPSSSSSSWERGGASLGSSPIGSLSPDAPGARGGVSPSSPSALGAVLGGAAVLAGSGRGADRERGEKDGERERGRERRGRDRTSGKVLGASVAAVPPPPVVLPASPPAPRAVVDAAVETASTAGEESSCGSSTVGDARTATGSVILQHPVRVPTPTITIPAPSSVREEDSVEADDAIHQDVLAALDDPAAVELRHLRRAEEEQRRRVHPTPSNSPTVELRRMAPAYADTTESASTSALGSGASGGTTPTGSRTPSAGTFPPGIADATTATATPDGGHTPTSPVTHAHHARSSSYSSITSSSSPAKMRPPTLSPTPALPARPSTSFTAASSPRLSSPVASPGNGHGGSSVAAVAASTGALNGTGAASASHAGPGQDTIVAKAVDIVSSAGAYFGLWGRDDVGR